MPSAEDMKKHVKKHRLCRKDYILLIALMIFAFIPSVNQLIVDRLISCMGAAALNAAGQIEWFDRINETLLAFLIVPLYSLFNRVSSDKGKMAGRICQTMVAGLAVYAAASAIVFACTGSMASFMEASEASAAYLRAETVAFTVGFMCSSMYVAFVVRGKWRFIAIILVSKVTALSVLNFLLIPEFGVMGIAYTNLCVNALVASVSFMMLYRNGLIHWTGFDRSIIKDWARIGLFSGGQALMANIVYTMIVMKTVIGLSEVGNYWLANNFVWYWLLVPMTAVSEMVKRGVRRRIRKGMELPTARAGHLDHMACHRPSMGVDVH